MKRFYWSSLRIRLILLVFLAVVPAAGLMLYTGVEARQTAAAAATQGDALDLAVLASADQDSLIESTRQLLMGLARLPQVRQGDVAACSTLFANLLKENPRYANLGVAKPNGDLWCSAVPISSPANYANRAWYPEVMRTRDFAIGGYVMGTLTRKPLSTFAYPVLDDARQIQGIVIAGIDLAWLNQFIARTAFPPGSVLTVMDSTGIVLARSAEPENWVGKQADAPIVKIIMERKSQGTVEAIGLDGVNRLYAFTPLGSQLQTGNAYVFVGIPTAVAYAQADQTLTRNLIALGVVMVLALLAAWWGSDAMVLRPLNGLLKATTRLARGDLDARTETVQGAGEISLLARAFDEMAANLQSSLGETTYNRRLLLALSQAAQAVQRAHTPQEIYRTVGEEITRLGYNAVITMIAPDRSHLTIAYLTFNPTLLQTAEKLAGITAHELRLPLTPGGIYDRVITEKRPHFVEKENEHIAEVLPGLLRPLAARLAAILGLGHSIYAPLVIGDAVLGLLTVIGAGLTETDAPVVNTFANQIAIALENARLYQETQQRAESLQIQRDLGSALNATNDIPDALNRTLDAACQLNAIDCGGVYLVDPATGQLDLAVHCGLPPGFVASASHYAADAPQARLVGTGKSFYVDATQIAGVIAPEPTVQGEGLRSLAVIPVQHEGRVIAALNLASHTHAEIPANTRHTLEVLATQLGGALTRINAESASRASEQRFRALVQNNSDLTVVFDAQGVCHYLAPSFERVLGHKIEEWIGKVVFELLHPDDLEQTQVVLGDLAAHPGMIKRFEFRLRHADGSYRDFDTLATNLLTDPSVRGIVGNARDITERKQAEEERRKNAERATALAEISQNLAEVTTDPQASLQLIARRVTELIGDVAMIRLLSQDGLYLDPVAVYHPDPETSAHLRELYASVRQSVNEGFAPRIFQTGQAILAPSIKMDQMRASIEPRLWPLLDLHSITSLVIAPLHSQGRIIGLLSVMRIQPDNPYTAADRDFLQDLADRAALALANSRLFSDLQTYTAKLESSNRELEQFAYVASHDLQEPLRMITSYVQLLARRYQGKLDGDADEFIGYAVDGASRMQRMINDLLAYSRLGTRAKSLEQTSCDRVLDQALANLKIALEESGAQVTRAPLPTVMADDGQLAQLFQNLIANAIKFRGEQAPHIHISAEQKDKEWVFAVRDNGIGMESKYFDRIFILFQRLHGKAEYSGTGIGLAICK